MRSTYKTICLFTAVTFCLTLSGTARAEDFPKGTFTNKGPDGATWSIKFDGKGKASVNREDMEMVTIEYKVTKDQIVFDKEEGQIAEKEVGPGTYKWKLDGKKLSFTKVEDKSEGRSQALTSGSWTKKD
jgi:hypothetical protein